jgi:hypothetical protein
MTAIQVYDKAAIGVVRGWWFWRQQGQRQPDQPTVKLGAPREGNRGREITALLLLQLESPT